MARSPTLEDLEVRAVAGRASAVVRALVACDRSTTGRVDLEAAWTEVTDHGAGPLESAELRVTAGSALVEPGAGPVAIAATQQLGDLRHRVIRYRPVAATRCREHLPCPRLADGTQLLPAETERAVYVPNRACPPRPGIHAIEPAFRWTRTCDDGMVTSVRETAGLRVCLERPWLASGAGEQLGVVIEAGPDDPDRPLHDLLTHRVTEACFVNRAGSALVSLVDPGAAGEDPVRIVGHEACFDAQRGLWYADIDLDPPESCVRLALVRYQPQSLEGCHVSSVVVADRVPLPPRRQLVARRDGRFGVRVTVHGPDQRRGRFAVRHDDGEGWNVRADPARNGALAELVLDWAPATPPPVAGRVVVEELQPGWALLGPDAGERVTYSETFDRAALA